MGFALFLLFLALTYLRPIEAFAPELVAYRPMLVLLLFTFAFAVAQAIRSGEAAATGQVLRVLAGFTAAIAVSVAATGWLGGVPAALIDFAPSLLMFLSIVMLVTTVQRLKATCAVLVACMVALSVAGAFAYHTGFMVEELVIWQFAGNDNETSDAEPDVVPADDTSGARLWRIRSLGFLSDPNDFGQAIVVALPMLFVFYRKRHLLRNLILIGMPTAMMLYALYLTHSRGALLGLGSLAFFSVKRVLGSIRTGLLIFAIVAAGMALDFTGGRAYTANEESAGGRIDAWSEGLKMFMHRPLSGVGYHRFTEHHSHTAHNSFVLCFAETGVIGYFFWLGLIVLVFKHLSRAIEVAGVLSEERRWATAMYSATVGFLTCALFLTRAYEPGLFILLGLSFAACFSVRAQVGADIQARLLLPIAWRAITFKLMVLTIAAVYLIVVVKNAMVGRSI